MPIIGRESQVREVPGLHDDSESTNNMIGDVNVASVDGPEVTRAYPMKPPLPPFSEQLYLALHSTHKRGWAPPIPGGISGGAGTYQ